MSKNYTHLSLVQRYQIEVLLLAGCKQKQIAVQLNVHCSTISRELKRNTGLAVSTLNSTLPLMPSAGLNCVMRRSLNIWYLMKRRSSRFVR